MMRSAASVAAIRLAAVCRSHCPTEDSIGRSETSGQAPVLHDTGAKFDHAASSALRLLEVTAHLRPDRRRQHSPRQIALDGEDIYWIEGRPAEGGRQVIVRQRPDGTREDVNPAPLQRPHPRSRIRRRRLSSCMTARSTSPTSPTSGSTRPSPGRQPRPLTPRRGPSLRRRCGRCAAQPPDLRARGPQRRAGEAKNGIVAVDLDTGDETLLVGGDDFYSARASARTARRWPGSPGTTRTCPGTAASCGSATLDADGLPASRARRSPADRTESIFQPEWSPAGVLYFVSDRSGWWNLYRWRDGDDRGRRADGGGVRRAAVGLRPVHLRLRLGRTASSAPTTSAAPGAWPRSTPRSGRARADRHAVHRHRRPARRRRRASSSSAARRRAAAPSSRSTSPTRRHRDDPARQRASRSTRTTSRRRRRSSSRPRSGLTAHGFFYPPTNRDYAAPGRRAAAPARHEPRRPDGATGATLSAARCSTGPAAASPCST